MAGPESLIESAPALRCRLRVDTEEGRNQAAEDHRAGTDQIADVQRRRVLAGAYEVAGQVRAEEDLPSAGVAAVIPLPIR
jgi:hypothetical protein